MKLRSPLRKGRNDVAREHPLLEAAEDFDDLRRAAMRLAEAEATTITRRLQFGGTAEYQLVKKGGDIQVYCLQGSERLPMFCFRGKDVVGVHPC